MRRSEVLWTIIVHIVLSTPIGNGNELTSNGENLDIRRAVNTSDTLWLFWQTYMNGFSVCKGKFCINEAETCIRNDMVNISDKEYYFNQTTRLENEEVENKYRGIFVNDTKPPKSMRVYEVDDPSLNDSGSSLYTLQYANDQDPNCIVFFVNDLGTKIQENVRTCEMYLRGSSVDKGPSDSCQTFFNKSCNAVKVYQPYSETCKRTPVATQGDNRVVSP